MPGGVRVTVYEDGVAQRFVEFNGMDSTYLDWFAQDNVVDSDWTDVDTDTTNFFSIFGRFYINRNFGGCNIDRGWLLVAEADDVCDFVPPGPYPVILYSSATTDANLNTADFRQADVLTVTVKFKDTARFSGYCIP
nr:hypothetical protein BaRGS_019194 [Batillaria attramentaria]